MIAAGKGWIVHVCIQHCRLRQMTSSLYISGLWLMLIWWNITASCQMHLPCLCVCACMRVHLCVSVLACALHTIPISGVNTWLTTKSMGPLAASLFTDSSSSHTQDVPTQKTWCHIYPMHILQTDGETDSETDRQTDRQTAHLNGHLLLTIHSLSWHYALGHQGILLPPCNEDTFSHRTTQATEAGRRSSNPHSSFSI